LRAFSASGLSAEFAAHLLVEPVRVGKILEILARFRLVEQGLGHRFLGKIPGAPGQDRFILLQGLQELSPLEIQCRPVQLEVEMGPFGQGLAGLLQPLPTSR